MHLFKAALLTHPYLEPLQKTFVYTGNNKRKSKINKNEDSDTYTH